MQWLKKKWAKLFEPAWKGKNVARALAAVNKITAEQELYAIATASSFDASENVRLAAVKKMSDQSLLGSVARRGDGNIASAALDRLTDQKCLMEVALMSHPLVKNICLWAAQKITDQAILAEIAMQSLPHGVQGVKKIAVEGIADRTLLLQIAQYAYTSADICQLALEKLQDSAVLTTLAMQGNKAALSMLTNNQEALAQVAEEAQEASVCMKIAELLHDREAAQRVYEKVAANATADPRLRMEANKKLGDHNAAVIVLKDWIVGSSDPHDICRRTMSIAYCAKLISMPDVSDVIVAYVLKKLSWENYHSLLKMLDDIPVLERLSRQAEDSKTASEEYRPADDPLAYGASRTTYTFLPESIRQAALDRISQLRGGGMLKELYQYPHTSKTESI